MESKPDVKIVRPVSDVHSDKTFQDLALSPAMITALAACGFERPSPVQEAAIPLGRVGSDLIVQAKSGTGKTAVFAIICLERMKPEAATLQALVLSPTRELAIQSEQVISRLSVNLPEPRASSAVFIGGLPTIDDEKKLRRLCHIAVGTPGRLCQLVQAGSLRTEDISMFVLDEADALLGESLYADVTWIYDLLPRRKQVMALSATYTPALLEDLEPLMKRPQRVMLCEESVALHAVSQFYCLFDGVSAPGSIGNSSARGTDEHPVKGGPQPAGSVFQTKVEQVVELLASVPFHQAAVFCNQKPQAEWLARRLSAAGYPAAYLAGDRTQVDRMEAMEAVRGFKLRVIVSTDVMARGVDLARVNLVINLDLPHEAATYMHRVGRTGRFGSRGICVSFVTQSELCDLNSYVEQAQGGKVLPLPEGPQLMHLMEQDLSSEWERQALQDLSAAPHTEPPPSLEQEKVAAAAAAACKKAGGEGKGVSAEGMAEQRQGDLAAYTQEELDAAWQAYWAQCYCSGSNGKGWNGANQQHGYPNYSWDPYGRQAYGSHPDYLYGSQPYGQHPYPHLPYASPSHQPCAPQGSLWPGQQVPAQPKAKQAAKAGSKASHQGAPNWPASKPVPRAEGEGLAWEGESEEGESELSDEVLFGKSVGGVAEQDSGVREEESSEDGEDEVCKEDEEGVDEGSTEACSDVPEDEELDGFAASLLEKLDFSLPNQPQKPASTSAKPQALHPQPDRHDSSTCPPSQATHPPQPWPNPQHFHDTRYGSPAYNSYYYGSTYNGPPPPYQHDSWAGYYYQHPSNPHLWHSSYLRSPQGSSPCSFPPPTCFPPPFPSCGPSSMSTGASVRCPSCTLLSFQAQYNSWVAHYSHWYTEYCNWYSKEIVEMATEENEAAAD